MEDTCTPCTRSNILPKPTGAAAAAGAVAAAVATGAAAAAVATGAAAAAAAAADLHAP